MGGFGMAVERPTYSFEKLEIYVIARSFRAKMYTVAKGLPPEEKFNLSSQMRRASLSLTSNIAEGHGRYHFLENIHFILQARGSLQELVDDLNLCADEKYLSLESTDMLKDEAFFLLKKLNGYISYLRRMKQGDRSNLSH